MAKIKIETLLAIFVAAVGLERYWRDRGVQPDYRSA